MEALILVATLDGPTIFARIGVMKALNRNVERAFDPTRKEYHWGGASWRGTVLAPYARLALKRGQRP
jgi:hypothetical protein